MQNMKLVGILLAMVTMNACAARSPIAEEGRVWETRRSSETGPEGTKTKDDAVEMSRAMAELKIRLAKIQADMLAAQSRMANYYGYGGGTYTPIHPYRPSSRPQQ